MFRLHLMVWLALLAILAVGCNGPGHGPDTEVELPDDTGSPCVDADGDGACADVDCDDSNPDIHPGAEDVCNGIDDDCDGAIDEDGPQWFVDGDGDGFGDPDSGIRSCEPVSDRIEDGSDCDDADIYTWPGAPELCDGGKNDCDQAEWSSAEEAGLVAWGTEEGWVDATATFATGTEESPATPELEESGTLRFCEGTYYLNLWVLYADLSVEGVHGSEVTTLHGAELGQVIAIREGSLSLSGVTVRGGTGAEYLNDGGAIWAYDSPTVSITDTVFRDNWSADDGGGLYLRGDELILNRVHFVDNRAFGSGGGIFVYDGVVSVSDSSFEDNVSGDGGGLYVYRGDVTLSECEFSGNTAASGGGGGGGGAVAVGTGEVSVDTCTFSRNESGLGGGGALSLGSGKHTVTGSSFDHNFSGGGGGAVATGLPGLTVETSTFTSNEAGGTGGGISAEGSVRIEGSEFTSNSAWLLGGGVEVYEGSLTVEGCTFDENQAASGGGVGVYEGSLKIVDCGFTENWTADSGGSGAGFMMYSGTADVKGSTFDQNETLHSGGAGYVYEGSMRAEYTEFTGNIAPMFGGGMFGGVVDFDFEECIFEGNNARWGAGLYTVEGTVGCVGSTSTSAGFLDNQASGYGGGVYTQEITSTSCDWGSGTSDNSPDDVSMDGFTLDDLEADETFSCDESGCE